MTGAQARAPTARNPLHLYIWSVIAFRLALDLSYALYVAPVFSEYDIFGLALFVDINVLQYLASFLFLIPAFFVPHDKRDFTAVFFLSATMFLYIPATSLWGLDAKRSLVGMFAMAVGLMAALAASKIVQRASHSPVLSERQSAQLTTPQLVTVAISAACSVAFVIISFTTDAIEGLSFSLADIYLNREFQSERIDAGFLAYFNLWTQKVFNPILLIIGLQRRNYVLIAFSLVMQLFFFGITQHRIHLFLPVIIVMVMLLYQRRIEISGILLASAGLIIFALLFSLVFQLQELPSLLFRRAFFVPPQVSFDWIAFFEGQRKMFWSDKLLSWIIDSTYNGVDPPTWLGWEIVGREFAFNSGIVGAGFANAGFAGIVFYGAVLGAMAGWVSNMVKGRIPIFMAAALLFGPFRTAWADSDLFAALLSHGLLLGLAVLWLYSSTGVAIPRKAAGAARSGTG